MKTCKRCLETQLLDSFDIVKNSRDGRGNICKKCYKLARSIKYLKNRTQIRIEQKEYSLKNKDKKREYNLRTKEYWKNYRKTNIQVKIKRSIKSRFKKALKGNFKTGSTVENLGCTISELKLYLESKFQPGMTWENYGRYGWHIDHIKPLCSFDLTKPENIKLSCHYTNLQPLWAHQNLSKGSKIIIDTI